MLCITGTYSNVSDTLCRVSFYLLCLGCYMLFNSYRTSSIPQPVMFIANRHVRSNTLNGFAIKLLVPVNDISCYINVICQSSIRSHSQLWNELKMVHIQANTLVYAKLSIRNVLLTRENLYWEPSLLVNINCVIKEMS